MLTKKENKDIISSLDEGVNKKGGLRLAMIIIILLIIGGLSAFALGGKNSLDFNFKNLLERFKTNTVENIASETTQVVVEEESATITAVKKISPSVVSIIVSKDLKNYYDNGAFPFNDFFFGLPFDYGSYPQENKDNKGGKTQVGGGTGFIISADGLILTNKHVVSDEEAEYTVILNDGKEYGAKILATDLVNDIAVVKIEAQNLTVVDLGDSDTVQLGQTVIAIGNSLGEYKNTVTKGVVSGIGRRVEAGDSRGISEVIEEAIQTDAAINPGNSGGPLINLSGQVIGINTAINSQGQLIGFAIPVNQAKQVIESVRKYGKIVRSFLGVRYVLVNERIAKANNLGFAYGALVLRGDNPEDLAIVPGGPADKAGLVENDIILEVEGKKVDENNNLAKLISNYKPGDKIELKIWHKGEERTVKVTLEEYKN
ncbi:MAG: trypsin-like peptidase domain-containing protein [bacterium]